MNRNQWKVYITIASIFLVSLQGASSMASEHVIFVSSTATGANDGTSWAHAYIDLQDGLSNASSGDEIWVKAGTYKPGTPETATFALKEGVDVYGGFAGTETLLSQRDVEGNRTSLFGQYGPNKANLENVYHVVTAGSGITSATRLDGFTIEKGDADGSGDDANGAGIFVDGGDPDIFNCLIKDNTATDGGGIYITDSGDPTIENCIIIDNSATDDGAGIHNDSGSGAIANCTVYANDASSEGGGLYVAAGQPEIRNSIFWLNARGTAPPMTDEQAQVKYGGGTQDVKYCYIDSCGSGSGFCGDAQDHNLGIGFFATPGFTNAPTDLTLTCLSLCIDAGDNAAVNQTEDVAGDTRKVDRVGVFDTGSGTAPIVDLGVYEAQSLSSSTVYVDVDATGTDDGSSWTNAYTDLQEALTCAAPDDEIWVAEGTYYPHASCFSSMCVRTTSFYLGKDVDLNGGFDGTETTKSQRDVANNETILSGDIDRNDTITTQSACTTAGGTWTSGTCYHSSGLELTENTYNSYHVVVVDDASTDAILDGFTVTAGHANKLGICKLGDNPGELCDDDCDCPGTGGECKPLHNQGPGVHIRRQTTDATLINNDFTLRWCTLRGNWSFNSGGEAHGACNNHGQDTVIENCTFEKNYAETKGGGLYIHGGTGTVSDCIMEGNHAVKRGGGLYINDGTPTVSSCLLKDNTANTHGGGLYIKDGSPTVSDCVFKENDGKYGGGGLYTLDGAPTISDCDFLGNSSIAGDDLGSGGGLYALDSPGLTVTGCNFVENESDFYAALVVNQVDASGKTIISDCVFVDNVSFISGAFWVGGAVADAEMINCVFLANDSTGFAGAIWGDHGDLALVNSLFVGNTAGSDGGAIYINDADVSITNTTFVGNHGSTGGALLVYVAAVVTLHNSILWDDTATVSGDEISVTAPGVLTVSYSDVEGGWSGTGNINADPNFVAPVTGIWDTSVDAVSYVATTYQTTFTDDSASFGSTDALVDLVFRGNTDNGNYTYIVASTGTTITVWGDVSADYVNAKTYEILDFHVQDCSPVVDAGDNDVIPADLADLDDDENTTEDTPLDLDFATRRVDDTGVTDTGNGTAPIVDMGAYEKQGNSSGCGR